MKKIAVLLSGRGSNFQAIYSSIKSGYIQDAEIAVVVSDKEDAKGLAFGIGNNLNAVFVDPKKFPDRVSYDLHIVDILKKNLVELVCLAGFMRIITPDFVNAFKNQIINIHPSLLPSFPGLHAQRQALEYGVKFSGCTVHFVDPEVDHGAIILQEAVPVKDDDTEDSLSERILQYEHKLYPKAVKLFLEGKIVIAGRKVRLIDSAS